VTRAFLGLGSNLGDRAAYLRAAVAATPDLVAVSLVYETEPVGGPDAQGAYLNLVVELDTPLDARGLLDLCGKLETAAGRVREVHWGPRTLDVDVLWVQGETVADPDLVVPHPRMHERRFVLAPLADLAPDLVPAATLASAVGAVWSVGALVDQRGEG
jgi:2-amino-4-hydroxy-6-hydroxymethyldihydropteridine diphosphokinase